MRGGERWEATGVGQERAVGTHPEHKALGALTAPAPGWLGPALRWMRPRGSRSPHPALTPAGGLRAGEKARECPAGKHRRNPRPAGGALGPGLGGPSPPPPGDHTSRGFRPQGEARGAMFDHSLPASG